MDDTALDNTALDDTAMDDTAMDDTAMDDVHVRDVADLLVRCSCVPLARVAEALGFTELQPFSEWFETCTGEHPEVSRGLWFSPTGTARAEPASDGPDEEILLQARRALAWVLDRQDTAHAVRALRRRRPIPTDPTGDRHG